MCGIFGGIGLSRDDIDLGLQAMKRGDDGFSITQLGPVWMGHRRHKILSEYKAGVSTGSSDQPYYSQTKKVGLVFNGELFNYQNIKSRLEKKGYEFISQGDTEVVLSAYLEWGADVFYNNDLDIMFGIAITDLLKNKLIFFRDWPGRIPLFFLEDINSLGKKRIVFSSELKGILSLPDVNFDNIRELKPGYKASVDLSSNKITLSTPVKRPISKKSTNHPINTGSKLLKLLDNACLNRLIGDKLPCLFFSGGLDSLLTTICIIRAARSRGIKDKLICYVFAVEGCESEDVRRAKIAFSHLERLGIELREIRRSVDDIIEATPNLISLFEAMSPSAVSFYPLPIYYYLGEQVAQDGFKAAIGGDGPDELLGAYDAWKELDYSHKEMSSYVRRDELINNIHEAILKRGSIMMMERGPVEMRFPFLETNVAEYLLSINPKLLTVSNTNAQLILEQLNRIKPFKNTVLGENFSTYLHAISNNKIIDFPLEFEYEKLFWKLPLFMAGLRICEEMQLEPDILISPKLRSQHGAGLTSLEENILERYRYIGASSDRELFKKIWEMVFIKRIKPEDIKMLHTNY